MSKGFGGFSRSSSRSLLAALLVLALAQSGLELKLVEGGARAEKVQMEAIVAREVALVDGEEVDIRWGQSALQEPDLSHEGTASSTRLCPCTFINGKILLNERRN